MNIEIPESVIKAECSDPNDATDDDQYTVNVLVGGVIVMVRTYPRGWRANQEYMSNPEEACDTALGEFGQALRALIGEVTP